MNVHVGKWIWWTQLLQRAIALVIVVVYNSLVFDSKEANEILCNEFELKCKLNSEKINYIKSSVANNMIYDFSGQLKPQQQKCRR